MIVVGLWLREVVNVVFGLIFVMLCLFVCITVCVEMKNPDTKKTPLKGTSKTFNEIDGSPLLLPSGNIPYRQFLANHAVLAYKHAREKGWTTQDLSEVKVKAEALLAHSLDKEAQERLALLWT